MKKKCSDFAAGYSSYLAAARYHFCSFTIKKFAFIDAYHDTVNALSTVFIAIFTIILAWKTWGLNEATRGLQELAAAQGEDTKKSIAAAEKSANAAILTATSNRAWMCFEMCAMHNFKDARVEGVFVEKGIASQVHWKNFGQSPAVDVECYATEIFVPILPIPDMTAPIFSANWGDNNIFGTAGVNKEVLGPIRPLLIFDKYQDFIDRHIAMIVYSCLRYKDVHGAVRISEACMRVRFNGWQQNPEGQTFPNYEVIPVGPQNRMT